ncbi:hypothetical protein VTO73DRAFT_3159 [Trametes versicolor]
MVLGSPSASLANKLVFWSPEDSSAADGDSGGNDTTAGPSTETEASTHDGVSMYVKVFEEMLKEVLLGEGKLFVQEELDCFMKYHRLPYAAKYLFCRLCLRKKDKWHRLSALKYQSELGNGIRDAMDILCGHPPSEEEDVKPAVQNMEIVIPEMEPNFRFDAHPQVKPDPDADPSTRTEPVPEAKPEVKEVKPQVKEVKPQVKPEVKPQAKPSSPKSPKYPIIKVEERDVIDLTFDDEEEEAPKAGPSRSPEYEPELPPPTSTPRSPDFSVFADDEEQTTPLELLDCLNTDELADIAKQLKIKLRSKKRDVLIESILRSSSTQGTLAFPVVGSRKGKGKDMVQSTLPFGSSKGKKLQQGKLPFKPLDPYKTQQDRVRIMAMNKLEKCIRLNADVVALFRRANLVYFRSTQHTPELLTPAVLARAKKWKFAEYVYARTPDIWRTRAELLAYEDALAVEAEVDDLLDNVYGPGARGRDRSTMSRTPGPGRTKTPVTPRKGTRVVADTPKGGKAIVQEDEESTRVKNARLVKDILESHYPRWQALVDTKPEGDDDGRRNALQRFECGHILTRVVCKGAHALGILHEYEQELAVLDALLAQKRWRRGRRGRWHDRRALLLMKHLRDATEDDDEQLRVEKAALTGVIAALEDQDTHIVFRPMLERRLTRCERWVDVPLGERHQCEGKQKKAEPVHVGGVRLDRRLQLDEAGCVVNVPTTGGKGKEVDVKARATLLRFLGAEDTPRKPGADVKPEKTTGKSVWRGRDGEEVSVEMLALQYYEGKGFKGFHCEGRIVTTLFGLLFWDIIFAPVPGAFETRYQSAPLDLAEDTFYYVRQPLADARLAEIKDGRAAEILEAAYDEHQGKMCVGVRWDLFEKDDLLGIVKGLKANGLAIICKLMCEEYAARTGGVPDLILWHPTDNTTKFVEVKGPNDSLQENQKVWIDVLSRAGVEVELCHVHEEGSTPTKVKEALIKAEAKSKKTPAKSRKTPLKRKAPAKKRKRGEEEESLPQFLASDEETTDYDELDKTSEVEEASPAKKQRKIVDEPESPTAQKVARRQSQTEDVEMA